jgi:hypothetical protein
MDSSGQVFWVFKPLGEAYKVMILASLEVVARDGIEPPTPAFSGLDTAILILLTSLRLLSSLATFPAYLLEQ